MSEKQRIMRQDVCCPKCESDAIDPYDSDGASSEWDFMQRCNCEECGCLFELHYYCYKVVITDDD